jgi:hypothetical protein
MTKLIVGFRNFTNAPKNQIKDPSNTTYIIYRYKQLRVSANHISKYKKMKSEILML